MKQKLNPLDERIAAFSNEFAKIPNFSRSMQDPEIAKAHKFIVAKITGIAATKDLIIRSFMPAVQKEINATLLNIRTSTYKEIIKNVDFDLEDLKYETIRLGYVLTFHKYENFVKQFLSLWESLSTSITAETNQALENYIKNQFNFNPKAWHEFPSVHKISFISNCTKHQDGKCKLDNPAYKKPLAYLTFSDDDIIKPTVQEYRKDIDMLLESTNMLVSIIAYANNHRYIEHDLNSYQENDPDINKLKNSVLPKLAEVRTIIERMIALYRTV